jgi:hypothetical protein
VKKENSKFLSEVFYKYWMTRVPELDELEAIDHLEWDLRNQSLVPQLVKCKTSSETKKSLKTFFKTKKIKSE